MSRRVLITGICGFVGHALTEFLIESDPSNEVIGIDNLSRRGGWVNHDRLRHRGVTIHHGDVRCQSDLDALPSCDWVIDAAANPTVLAGLDGHGSPRGVVENNLLGTVNVLEYCRRWKAGLILLSTSRVYSIDSLRKVPLVDGSNAFAFDHEAISQHGVSELGIDETFSTSAPISLYGATKLASEQLALEYGATFDFPVWVNRCGVLAGAGQFARADQGIFAYWLHRWQAKQSPLRYLSFGGRGFQVRDCLHPHDLATLVELQMRSHVIDERPQVINVSGGIDSARSLHQLSQWCENRWGSHDVIASDETRRFDIPWLILNSQLAERVWNWSPQIGTDEILAEIAAFAEIYPEWLSLTGSS